eukprot:scaffold76038_cov38-Tisochrysis_lutea.AAC.3
MCGATPRATDQCRENAVMVGKDTRRGGQDLPEARSVTYIRRLRFHETGTPSSRSARQPTLCTWPVVVHAPPPPILNTKE